MILTSLSSHQLMNRSLILSLKIIPVTKYIENICQQKFHSLRGLKSKHETMRVYDCFGRADTVGNKSIIRDTKYFFF